MELVDLIADHFEHWPGVIAHNVMSNHCMLWWTTIPSQLKGYYEIDMSRDQLVLQHKGDYLLVKRIDCAERIIWGDPWKVIHIADPKLFSELHKMMLSL